MISASITQNSTSTTVNGNYGKDSVVLSAAGVNSAMYFVAGGAGADTITVQGVTTAATSVADVRGGGGNDSLLLTQLAIPLRLTPLLLKLKVVLVRHHPSGCHPCNGCCELYLLG